MHRLPKLSWRVVAGTCGLVEALSSAHRCCSRSACTDVRQISDVGYGQVRALS